MGPRPDGGHDADTNWSALGVEQMWDMVKDHDEALGWTHRLAWQQVGELLDMHHYRLTAYRERLATAWPAESSPAAAAFLAHIDTMLDSLSQMRDAAGSNGPALGQINASLGEARTELAGIHEAWTANQTALTGYRPASAPPTPAPLPGPSPVPAGEQAALHAKAVTIMSTLARQTLEAKAAMKQPPPYQPPSPVGYDEATQLSFNHGAVDSTRRNPSSFDPSGSGAASIPGLAEADPGHRPRSAGPTRAPIGDTEPLLPSPRSGPLGDVVTSGPVSPWPTGVKPSGQLADPNSRASRQATRTGTSASVNENQSDAQAQSTTRAKTREVPSEPNRTAISGNSGLPIATRTNDRRRHHLDEHWEMPQGVPPIIAPPSDGKRYDSGPFLRPRS